MRESSELSDDEAATVAEVCETVTKDGGSKRVKQHDKIKALELLGRHLGMWDRRENTPDEAEITKIRVIVEDGRTSGTSNTTPEQSAS